MFVLRNLLHAEKITRAEMFVSRNLLHVEERFKANRTLCSGKSGPRRRERQKLTRNVQFENFAPHDTTRQIGILWSRGWYCILRGHEEATLPTTSSWCPKQSKASLFELLNWFRAHEDVITIPLAKFVPLACWTFSWCPRQSVHHYFEGHHHDVLGEVYTVSLYDDIMMSLESVSLSPIA